MCCTLHTVRTPHSQTTIEGRCGRLRRRRRRHTSLNTRALFVCMRVGVQSTSVCANASMCAKSILFGCVWWLRRNCTHTTHTRTRDRPTDGRDALRELRKRAMTATTKTLNAHHTRTHDERARTHAKNTRRCAPILSLAAALSRSLAFPHGQCRFSLARTRSIRREMRIKTSTTHYGSDDDDDEDEFAHAAQSYHTHDATTAHRLYTRRDDDGDTKKTNAQNRNGNARADEE